jgi:hypothetical protein
VPNTPATPKPWLILQALEAALQQITVANGYRTDIGSTVSLEKVQDPADVTEAIVIYSGPITKPDEPDNRNTRIKTREFEIIIEAAVPVTMDAGVVPAHQRMHDILEDIEQALSPDVPSTPGAIPPVFRETIWADRPAGLAAIVMQYVMDAKYRRDR